VRAKTALMSMDLERVNPLCVSYPNMSSAVVA